MLESYGVTSKIVKILQSIYENAEAAMLIDGHLSEWFRTTAGNKQGNPTSANLYTMLLERIIWMLWRR